MKSLVQKDKFLRQSFSNQEIKQKTLFYTFRNLLNNSEYTKKLKVFVFSYLYKKNKNITSKTKIVRRCVLTGRSRSSSRISGISRIKMRELIRDKKVKNILKSTW